MKSDNNRKAALSELVGSQPKEHDASFDLLWIKLMDALKKRGIAPSNANELFALIGDLRKSSNSHEVQPKEQGAEPVAERSLDAGELAVQFNAITAHETCVHCDDGEIGPEVCQFCHGHGSVPPHEQVIKDRVRRLFVNYRSAPTSREKAMEEAGDAMDELLDGPWHIYDENREKAISVWRAAKSTK